MTPINIYILLDRSSSMSANNLWNEAIESINLYADKLKNEARIYLAIFDNVSYDVLRTGRSDWTPVLLSEASPRGMTPLLDATGKLIKEALKDNSEKAIIVIMTDGEENSSTEFTLAQIKSQLAECEKRGWGVVFLGANFDGVAQSGAAMGYSAGRTVNFKAGTLGRGFETLSMKSSAYASMDSKNVTAATLENTFGFTQAERAEIDNGISVTSAVDFSNLNVVASPATKATDAAVEAENKVAKKKNNNWICRFYLPN